MRVRVIVGEGKGRRGRQRIRYSQRVSNPSSSCLAVTVGTCVGEGVRPGCEGGLRAPDLDLKQNPSKIACNFFLILTVRSILCVKESERKRKRPSGILTLARFVAGALSKAKAEAQLEARTAKGNAPAQIGALFPSIWTALNHNALLGRCPLPLPITESSVIKKAAK